MIDHYEVLYAQSIELIDTNPNLPTNKIPDNLLEVWIYNGLITSDAPFEMLFAMSIFKYIVEKYNDLDLNSECARSRFKQLQYILATEFVCRKVGAKMHPRNICDTSRYMDPLHIDIKRHQQKAFRALSATFVPLRVAVNFN